MKKADYLKEAELHIKNIEGEKKEDRQIRLEKIVEDLKEAEKVRQKYLKGIKYKSFENTYSFEFEGTEYTFKGYPSIIDKAQIRVILNSIAPGVRSSEAAIFGSEDIFLKSLATGIAYSQTLIISPDNFNPSKFCVDKNGESDEGKYSAFGLSVMMAELEFKKSKKKQS